MVAYIDDEGEADADLEDELAHELAQAEDRERRVWTGLYEDGGGSLVKTEAGYTVQDRMAEPERVGVDPFRKPSGHLGKLTPEQKRVRDAYGEFNDPDLDNALYGEPGEGDGYLIEKTGATGAPTGRPRLGTKDPKDAAHLLETEDGRTKEQLRALIGRGKPTDLRLARTVHALIAANRVTDQALADALECNRSTIHRLAKAAANATKLPQ